MVTINLMGMKPDTDWEARLFYVIQHLEKLDPDIIGLQEINEIMGLAGEDNMAKTIAASLEEYFGTTYEVYYQITHVSWDRLYEGVGVISKHPIYAADYNDLPAGVFPRKVVWTHINSPLGWINFFNTHLSYRSKHNSIRVRQVKGIMEFITEKENAWPGIGTILTGDFNCTPDSEPLSRLVVEEDSAFTMTYFEVHPQASGFTQPSHSPVSKIDYILYKNTGSLVIDTSMIILDQPYNGTDFPSDHFGIMTVFLLESVSRIKE